LGRVAGHGAAACRGYCPYSSQSFGSPGKGWASSQPLKAGSAGSLHTPGPGSSFSRAASSAFGPAGGLPPGRRRFNNQRRRKARGPGSRSEATPLQADGSGSCDSALPSPLVPASILVTAGLCSSGITQNRLGRSNSRPHDIQARARPLDPANAGGAGRSITRQAGRFQQARRKISVGLWPPEPLRARFSRSRPMCHQPLAGCPMPIRLWRF